MGTQHDRPCPIPILKSDVVMVKPSSSTPLNLLSLSTIDNDPYIEALAKTIYVYKPSCSSVPDYVEPASLLQHALSKALVYYYPLAGKLKRCTDDRKLQLNCTADGVPFIRATVACTLSSLNYLDGADLDIVGRLVPDYDAVSDESCGYYHPLALQVTVFSCGGFTVGTALSHSVCDGFGAAQFFRALTELASGKSEPSVKPVWERHRLVGQVLHDGPLHIDPNPKPLDLGAASIATSPYTPTDDMVREIVNVTSDSIKRLKARIIKETSLDHCDHDEKHQIPRENFTTLEILGAYVWRARSRALKLNPEGLTLFGLAVGVRPFVKPPLPEGYYGNAFVKANVVLTARELNDSPLSHIVKLIKNIKKTALGEKYLWDQLREAEKMMKMNVKLEGGHGAFMLLTDWRQMSVLDEVDFGWKGSVNIIPLVALNLPDICIFLPASKVVPAMEGGVQVMVTLPRAAMPKFMEEMDSLSKTGSSRE